MITQFREFEDKNQLFTLEINGVRFWHLVRFDIYNSILNNKKGYSEAQGTRIRYSKKKYVESKFKQVKYLFSYKKILSSPRKDILVLDHPRKVLDESNYYIDLYTNFLLSEYTENIMFLDEPLKNEHMSPQKDGNIFYTDIINLEYNLKKIIYRKGTFYNNKKNINIVEDLINSINLEFGIKLSSHFWNIKIIDKILFFKIACKYIEKILKHIKPKVIIEVVSYTGIRFAVNYIAKKLNIETIELQHGLIGPNHVAYNISKINELYYFPNRIFTFGDYWNEHSDIPLSSNMVEAVGFPYLEIRKDHESVQKDKNSILFISQGTIGKELSKFAIEVEKIYGEDYSIEYKLHPGEYDNWEKNYPWLLESNIRVIGDDGYDIYFYYNTAVCVIGVYSTALIEALYYDLNVLIYNTIGSEYLNDFIEFGDMNIIQNGSDISKYLNIVQEHKNYNYYWREHPRENVIFKINQILEEKEGDNEFK
ncbi:hypothetical protein PML80_06805 [Aerococcus urinaeequi]|uniref:CDP-glycerol glycerophosphotransferase family protein n=1 Tax=Aerococcus urinaeequi TaxID=51665 RepID=A0AAE9XQ17_9LACT|nr:hypothetical protein [Aerococcus urinaeequi]WCG37233.1 hypothetical protein PML80_06805 [Aerococcus urinaeequi]